MTLVGGIDLGSLDNTLSYVALLDQREFELDVYTPRRGGALPEFHPCAPAFLGIDAPQGLPLPDEPSRRLCDQHADTPTRVLPRTPDDRETAVAYRALIDAGVAVFWEIAESRAGKVFGLDAKKNAPLTAFETYPRYVVRRLWPDDYRALPSKRKAPFSYVDFVWSLLRSAGYHCHSVRRPMVDQIDAMLCAVAAEALAGEGWYPAWKVGGKPERAPEGGYLRGGYIVVPKGPGTPEEGELA